MELVENSKNTSTVDLVEIENTSEREFEFFNYFIPLEKDDLLITNYFYQIYNKIHTKKFNIYQHYVNSFIISTFRKDIISFGKIKHRRSDIKVSRDKILSENIIEQLRNLSKCKDNWDSYGAREIKWSTIANAIEFFMRVINNYPDSPVPFISPYPDGSIHVEWQTFSKKLHHLIPEDDSEYFIYRMTIIKEDKHKEYFDKTIGINGMLKIFNIWYNYE
jgi:hypothetical protein